MGLSRSLVAIAIMLLPMTLLADGAQYDAELTIKIDKIIRGVQQIKVGMTKADLLKVFTTEGGLSSRKWRRYVHRSCPYIKVNVVFDLVGEEKDLSGENAKDKITKISQPFLELSIRD